MKLPSSLLAAAKYARVITILSCDLDVKVSSKDLR